MDSLLFASILGHEEGSEVNSRRSRELYLWPHWGSFDRPCRGGSTVFAAAGCDGRRRGLIEARLVSLTWRWCEAWSTDLPVTTDMFRCFRVRVGAANQQLPADDHRHGDRTALRETMNNVGVWDARTDGWYRACQIAGANQCVHGWGTHKSLQDEIQQYC